MTVEAAEIARSGGANGDGPSPTGQTRLPQPTDAGLAAILRASRRFGAAGMRLLTRQSAVESRTSLATVASARGHLGNVGPKDPRRSWARFHLGNLGTKELYMSEAGDGMIVFLCPVCKKKLKTPPSRAGQAAHCPRCWTIIHMPAPGETDATVRPPSRELSILRQAEEGEKMSFRGMTYEAHDQPAALLRSLRARGRGILRSRAGQYATNVYWLMDQQYEDAFPSEVVCSSCHHEFGLPEKLALQREMPVRCPDCGGSEILLIYTGPAPRDVGKPLTYGEVEAVRKYCGEKAKLWWEKQATAPLNCDRCFCRIERGDGHLYGDFLYCGKCLTSLLRKVERRSVALELRESERFRE